ncbi:hypothetical protein BDP81DRAFT_426044 [Colletotrichum phormii]|uniref:NADH:flavin oxidoreductase/NADH oxidase N-terminal domain-containing protein n=1 Tax=Colletotrichum phormii TaxID=359342 RepID=A0AAI9ZU13_9PEZI|nr:uncharacterized protein BDP81DRAFT_426044 [Colletotrichum phormii]KAK1637851.1 hypothetical protein BDP81DRAFT_426044 [Colletotrichum phormii]
MVARLRTGADSFWRCPMLWPKFFGPELVCIKICPTDQTNDSVVTYEEMKDVYTYLIRELVKRRVGIINLSRRGASHRRGTGDFFGNTTRPGDFPLPLGYGPVMDFGPLVKFPNSPSKLMANYDYTVDEADRLVRDGKLDLITFGRPFIYNPVSVTFSVYWKLHSNFTPGCDLSNPT